jgi:predicted component of type VI protein secretion system
VALIDLVRRFNAIAPYAVEPQRWHELASDAAAIVHLRSKDIGVAAYLTVAWVHNHDVTGLLDGLVLMRELAQRYWYWLYPAVAKPRSRAFVIEWLAQQTASLLYRAETRTTLVELQAVQAVVDQLDVMAWDKLGEHYHGSEALRRALLALRLRFENPQAFAQVDQQRQAVADRFGRPGPLIIGPPPLAPPVAAHPVQRWQGIAALVDQIPQPDSRLRALHAMLAALRAQAGARPDHDVEQAIEREIVALSHQLGILPGAPSYAEPAPFTPAPPAVRRARAAIYGQDPPRSMRGAAARHDPLPPEGPPVPALHLTVHVRPVPGDGLRSLRLGSVRALTRGVPYRLEISLAPTRDPSSLVDAELATAELRSAEPGTDFGLPQLHVGLEAACALLAFADHPGSVGPRLVSDPLPCSRSHGTNDFQFDIMATGGAVEVDVTVWLRQEVLVRARVVLPAAG